MASTRRLSPSDLTRRLVSSWQSHATTLANRPDKVAVACSGGPDSMVLLDLLSQAKQALQVEIVVLHVDHGLQAASGEWGLQVKAAASARELECVVLRIDVVHKRGESLEECARKARYAALDGYCRQHSILILALGHHADDQAETVLLQLTRGAGVAGLSGMAEWDGRASPCRWRPLIGVQREVIEQVVIDRQLECVQDPSNQLRAFARNALRHDVMPALKRVAPGAIDAMSRSALHLQQALELEREVGEADLAEVRIQGGLSITRLHALSPARRSNCLRQFVRSLGVRVPSTDRLNEVWRQVSVSRPEAQPSVAHGEWRFVRHRDCLMMAPAAVERAPGFIDVPTLRWSGESTWAVPGWRGSFHFDEGDQGLPETVLRTGMLEARPRQGGESMRLAANRPRRSLKQLYQTFDVPAWQRDASPLLYCDGRLVFVPLVGLSHEWSQQAVGGVPRRSIAWSADGG